MLDQYGGVSAAKRLLAELGIQEALMELWELGLLDQSREAVVLQERFGSLFAQDEIDKAYCRLDDLGFFKR